MSDRWAVALALSALVGAARPSGAPMLVGVLLVVAALLVRRPWLLCLGTTLLVSALASRSLAGLDGPARVEVVRAEVTLLSDPEPSFTGVRADVRMPGGRRVEARADGVAADALRPRLAGEIVTVRGDLGPSPPDSPWLLARHVSGRLRIYRVEGWRPGGPPARLANAARRTLVEGARGFSPVDRSLYTGLVIGDDREQPATLADDFLGSGLTHLLAVSGQNVAFVLALAGPALRRLRLWPRLFATLAVVALFGLMTRFEPSVLRAAAMAALATTSLTIGSPVSRLRILALSVTALLVVDPLLVRSVGFQLSAAASAAIVLWAGPVMAVLPGPLLLREPLAVTVAAQLGVAPVLLATFGPLPVASFPANVLAVPIAGAVMVWGLTAGMVAGVAGATVAQVLHGPTHLMLAWLSQVAARTAALPLGQLGAPHVAALAGGLAVAARWPGLRRAGLVVAALALGAAVVVAQAPAGLRTELQPGVVRWHAGSSDVVVLGGVGGRSALSASSVLASLRQAGVGSLDLLVVADPSISSGVVTSIEARHHVGAIVVDGAVELTGTDAPLVRGPAAPATVTLGALEVRLTPTPDRLVVDARRVGSTDARSGVAGGLRTP